MIEHGVEKIEVQPVVHDPTFVDPADDSNGAQGFVMTVWCDTPPTDGDVAIYIAANNRFELRAQTDLSTGELVTVDDGSGGFLIVFDENGNAITT